MQKFLETVAKKAGLCLSHYYNAGVKKQNKGKFGDVVTIADYAAEKIIISAIEKKFPQYNILSEEAGYLKKESDYTFIIDPLDGTKNFANHVPLFGTTIALAHKGIITHGIIFDPIHNELFYAQKGRGAFLNKKKIKTSAKKELKHLTGGVANVRSRTNINFYNNLRNKIYNYSSSFKILGSAIVDLNYVASGKLDMYVMGGVYPWDVAAGGLLILEAGGIISTVKGEKWDPLYSNQEILVSGNKILHRKILKIIK